MDSSKPLHFNHGLLDELMIIKGMTGVDVAERLSKGTNATVSGRSVQRWRGGPMTPGPGFVKRLAHLFEIPIHSFYEKEILPFANGRSLGPISYNAIIKREVIEALQQEDMFFSSQYALLTNRIAELPQFSGLSASTISPELQLNLTMAGLTGLFDLKQARQSFWFNVKEEIVISMPVTMVGSIVVLEYIKRSLQLPFHITYDCCNGIDAMNAMKTTKVHLSVLPTGAASTAMKFGPVPYKPVMLMPGGSYAIMSNRNSKKSGPDGILMVTDRPSSAVTYIDELIKMGDFDPSIPRINSENTESLRTMIQEDASLLSAQWFPHYDLGIRMGMKLHRRERPTGNHRHLVSTFLFAREDIAERAADIELLSRFIRNAWMILRMNDHLVQEMIDTLCPDDQAALPTSLQRCSGAFSTAMRT